MPSSFGANKPEKRGQAGRTNFSEVSVFIESSAGNNMRIYMARAESKNAPFEVYNLYKVSEK